MNTLQQKGEALLKNDVELRAPLPPEHCCSVDNTGPESSASEIAVVHVPRSTLCRMFVACHVLELTQEARFTSLVLFHRYHYNRAAAPMEEQERDETKMVAAACLFLGCKAQDELRRLRDVINVAHVFQFDKTETTSSKSKDTASHQSLETISVLSDPPPLDETYWQAKEQLVSTEQAVLRMLQFDVLVSHPHRLVVLLAEEISSEIQLVAVAWRRLNDALFSSQALMCAALPLACAALGLALQETQEKEGEGVDKREKVEDLVKSLGLTKHWLQAYGVDEASLELAMKRLREASGSVPDFQPHTIQS